MLKQLIHLHALKKALFNILNGHWQGHRWSIHWFADSKRAIKEFTLVRWVSG